MGTWDHTIFGNDIACDWIYDLEKCTDLSFIDQTLDNVLTAGETYLDAPIAEEALAALETITRLKGNGGEKDTSTEDLDKWVAGHPGDPSPVLIEKGKNALIRILSEPSEILDLWKDSDEFDNWKTTVTNLQTRLNSLG